MARRKNPLNSPISLLATVLMMILIVPAVILPFIESLGGFGEIITDLIELLPFGYAFYEVAIQLIGAVGGQAVNYHAIQGVFTGAYVFQELAEGIFTIIIYEGLRLVWFIPAGLTGEVRGRWQGPKKLVISVAMAVVAACLAPALINKTFSRLFSLGKNLRLVFSGLISIVLTGGGIAFFLFLKGFSLLQAVLFFVLKFLVVGAIRLAGSYTFLFVFLLGCQQQTWSMIVSGMSGFLFIIVLMAAVELMVESIFQ